MKRCFGLVLLVCALLCSSGCGEKEVPVSILGQEVETTGTFEDRLGSHTYTMELLGCEPVLYRIRATDGFYEETEETCERVIVDIHIDNDEEYWGKMHQLFEKYREIYADEIEKNGIVEYGEDFEAEEREIGKVPEYQGEILAELTVIRYDFESKKAIMYESWDKSVGTSLCVWDDLQGVDESGMEVPYPGVPVYAEVKFYINGVLKDTMTMGTYMKPNKIIEME